MVALITNLVQISVFLVAICLSSGITSMPLLVLMSVLVSVNIWIALRSQVLSD